MGDQKRFTDRQLTVRDFFAEVAVVCPVCGQKAIAFTDEQTLSARLVCSKCGHNRQSLLGVYRKRDPATRYFFGPAHGSFGVGLWYSVRFRNNVLWALNETHLNYLEEYIRSGIRENPARTHFTMVEKLPKFMQIARNREPLLKIISHLKRK